MNVTYTNRNGSITVTDVYAKIGLRIDNIKYGGYYLIASAKATSEKFSVGGRVSRLYFYSEEDPLYLEDREDILWNRKLSEALNSSQTNSLNTNAENAENADLAEDNEDLYTFYYVYDIKEEVYERMYGLRNSYSEERESAIYSPEIQLHITGGDYLKSPGVFMYAYFCFFYREVQFDELPE